MARLIAEIQDEVEKRKEVLIDEIEARMKQAIDEKNIFFIRWILK